MDTEIVRSRDSKLNYALRSARSIAVISRFADFWLLGGASVLVWAILIFGQAFRDEVSVIENHFQQLGAFCSLMSIFCNYPHFIISYRFGYGRGFKFVLKNWFPLIAVPLGLIALYDLAYFKFDTSISDLWWFVQLNAILEIFGIPIRPGVFTNIGTVVMTLSLWIMNLTVGWHYSKQAFGCMMVYAHYDQYLLTKFQRNAIRTSVLSVAVYYFLYFVNMMSEPNSAYLANSYSVSLPSIGIPKYLLILSGIEVMICAAVVIKTVFINNYVQYSKMPSWNFLIPWVAIHIWWIPVMRQKEFLFLLVPFFHSLQYLPFAYRLERPKVKKSKWIDVDISLRVALLIVTGFLAFEFVPSVLDKSLETMWNMKVAFFMSAFAVFINVHHFFIDSAVWKFDQADVRENLLSSRNNSAT